MFFPSIKIRRAQSDLTKRTKRWDEKTDYFKLTAQKMESGCSFFRPWRGESCWWLTRTCSTWGRGLTGSRWPPMELETGELVQAARRLPRQRCRERFGRRSCARWGQRSASCLFHICSSRGVKRSFSTKGELQYKFVVHEKAKGKKWLEMKFCLPWGGEEVPQPISPRQTPREEFPGLLTDVRRKMEEMMEWFDCSWAWDTQKASRLHLKLFLASQSAAWSSSARLDRWKKYWNKIKISFVFLKFRNEERGESDCKKVTY